MRARLRHVLHVPRRRARLHGLRHPRLACGGAVTRYARLAIAAAIVIAVVLWLTACSVPDAATSPGYVSGDGAVTEWAAGERPGPLDLTGATFEGDEIALADYEGEVVIITTWYANCPPCRAEAPDLIELDALDGVNVLGVNVRD